MGKTPEEIAREFMNAGKSEEQRRNDALGKLVSDILGPTADPFSGLFSQRRETPKSPGEIVTCKSCGQKNRINCTVGEVLRGKKPVCGKCKKELSL